MIKMVALYRKPENPGEFDRRYFEEHLPLARKMPGLRKLEVAKMSGAPQGETPYYMIAELYFDNMEALKTAMASEQGRAAAKDVMSFAKGIVEMMFAHVEEKAAVTVS